LVAPACFTRRLNTVWLSEKGDHMIHPTIRRLVHCTALVSLCLCLMTLFCGAGIASGAVVGDQVELKARIRAGVPLHQELRGTPDFQRIPNGTKATVIALAQDGRWLKLALPDGRTGWVTTRPCRTQPDTISAGGLIGGRGQHTFHRGQHSPPSPRHSWSPRLGGPGRT
jgi:hypothetical protein